MDQDHEHEPAADPAGGGRRAGERRKAEVPFAGEDRRKADRRKGTDRRAAPREDTFDPD